VTAAIIMFLLSAVSTQTSEVWFAPAESSDIVALEWRSVLYGFTVDSHFTAQAPGPFRDFLPNRSANRSRVNDCHLKAHCFRGAFELAIRFEIIFAASARVEVYICPSESKRSRIGRSSMQDTGGFGRVVIVALCPCARSGRAGIAVAGVR
jgi:hypothetical protein